MDRIKDAKKISLRLDEYKRSEERKEKIPLKAFVSPFDIERLIDSVIALAAALEEKEKENEELKNRLSAMHAFDPDGDWPSYGELALMYAEQEKANEKLLKLHEIACDDAEAEIARLSGLLKEAEDENMDS